LAEPNNPHDALFKSAFSNPENAAGAVPELLTENKAISIA
jgi:hypothetical protein